MEGLGAVRADGSLGGSPAFRLPAQLATDPIADAPYTDIAPKRRLRTRSTTRSRLRSAGLDV